MTTIFHLGYPKSASTSLQVGFFPYFNGIEYIGPIQQNNSSELSRPIDKIKSLYDIDSDINYLHYWLAHGGKPPNFEKYTYYMSKYNNLIISNEDFLDFRYNSTKFNDRLQRLKKIIQKDDVILCITRNPKDILVSMYRDHPIIYSGMNSIVSIDDFINYHINDENDLLNFIKIKKNLIDFFPEAKVIFINYNEIINDIDFLKKFILKIDSNIQYIGFDKLPIYNSGNTSVQFLYRVSKHYLKPIKFLIPSNIIYKIDKSINYAIRRFGKKKEIIISDELINKLNAKYINK